MCECLCTGDEQCASGSREEDVESELRIPMMSEEAVSRTV